MFSAKSSDKNPCHLGNVKRIETELRKQVLISRFFCQLGQWWWWDVTDNNKIIKEVRVVIYHLYFNF